MESTKFSHCVPFLPVFDLSETIDFYQKKLGFTDLWTWGNPPSDVRIRRDELSLLINQNPQKAAQTMGIDIMIFLTGIETIYAEYQSRNLSFSSLLEEKPWGIWEFALKDNNGYYLRFAQGIGKNDPE